MNASTKATDPGANGEQSFAARPWSFRALVTAVQFLTRLPISSQPTTADALQMAPVFFPLIGSLIGCATAASLFITQLAWPLWIAVPLALGFEALLTGALHEDGLADFCDGVGGGWEREDVLRIFKDSRIGTYGTVGLVVGLALRAACMVTVLARFGSEQWIYWVSAIVAASGVGRWAILLTMTLIPPIAERHTLTKDVARQLSWRRFAGSGLGVLPVVVLFAVLLPLNALLAFALVSLAWLWLAWLVRRKLQGVTGDCLGCIGYVCQVMFLLGAAAGGR
jgi:adenosylcobinamide-GDP ribazoletransferase